MPRRSCSARMPESWWLKLERAEKHADEFKTALRPYLDSQPYKAVKCGPETPGCQQHADCWRYCLRITQQPDPALSIIAGDFLHNVRSALDHLAVAMVPARRRSKASFPIERDDIWTKQGRRYVIGDAERRGRFKTAVDGMSAEAKTEIQALQPYNRGAQARSNTMYLLNRLDNADKHRQLLLLAPGLNDVVSHVVVRGQTLALPMPNWADGHAAFVDDGAVVAHFGYAGTSAVTKSGIWYPAGPLQDEEVSVEVRGSPEVALQIVDPEAKGPRSFMPFVALVDAILWDCRHNWIPTLEPFVRGRT